MSFTRREFLAGSAVATVAGALGRPALARAWQTQTAAAGAPMQAAQGVFTPIRGNAGFFTMRGGTIGYVIDPKGIAVIDSQYPAEAKVCLDGINERSKSRPIDFLINTHHHGDHTNGNVTFRGTAKKVVSQAKAAELMKAPPGANPPAADQLFPDTTFTDTWTADVGGEKVRAKFYGPAHTSGDAVITLERANIAHMGDLAFNQRHPIVDRAAGASIRNWITVVERAMKDHSADTVYIFGHAGANLPVTGSSKDVAAFRDYLSALLAFVGAQIKAGKSREEVLAMRDPLKGFESYGPFGASNPREALTVAYEELTAK